ncbi:DUF3299 domain-containing protein [Noviherbaspirillum sp. CPCC 100848]|uniref:DUF3299 domain-containing protein n=1 Tax=Noviherbaspirillum album TaxID=3080276 RepID=A0ABU6J932_9BURK|nr:DUF3299 domain-containing protein [Noviherbaspirillum sp. CPCC 100848]MEC4719787.1 DUF3299 domain-containing protein [Noviherbaspirillum sp. CPCC 100848]
MMKALPALLCCVMLAASTPSLHAQQDKSDYKVGERLPQPKAPAAMQAYKELTWEGLVPKNWDPSQMMKGLDLSRLSDSDPRAMEALEKMRKAWSEAPVEPSLNGARVRIAGFLVPLDAKRGQVKEFLLVPYFGACIHTPPPPANQIIHAVAVKPLKEVQVMSAVWVSGTLETARSTTEFGDSGYRLKADMLAPYQ